MKNNRSGVFGALVLLLVVCVVFGWGMNHCFNCYPAFREIFSGASGDVYGEVAANSEASLAARALLTARISMLIFTVITIFQFIAFAVGYAVVSGIRKCDGSPKYKLDRLDNAEIFFDVPLYVGLFGTISAFLVMTFSPQSSRLIAYSSTLIGIIFSLILRLTVQYPLRLKLITTLGKEGAAK